MTLAQCCSAVKGVLRAFKGQLIHSFNKREGALSQAAALRELQGRPNVLLLGDSLGDLTMADGGAEHQNVLTIGFLNDRVSLIHTDASGSPERVLTPCAVSRRWTREKNRTSTPSTSCWWETRRWTFPTPSSDSSPHEEESDTLWRQRHRRSGELSVNCMLVNRTSPLTSESKGPYSLLPIRLLSFTSRHSYNWICDVYQIHPSKTQSFKLSKSIFAALFRGKPVTLLCSCVDRNKDVAA